MSLFAVAVFFTILGNWAVPFFLFWKTFGLFKKRPQGFVGTNFWGIIMDVILASAINIIVLNYILLYKSQVTYMNIFYSLILGFAFTVFIHFFMIITNWKIWIMPKPWHLNLAGKWHLVSMTLQMAFVFFPLIMFWQNPSLINTHDAQKMLIIVGILVALFLISLYFCDRGLKIGKLEISGKSW